MNTGQSNEISIFSVTSTLYQNELFMFKLKSDDLDWYRNNYIPSMNDVYIATYPKCGTTWVSDICYEINKHYFGESNAFPGEYKFVRSISPTKLDAYLKQTQNSLRFWKVHAPSHVFPIKDSPFDCNLDIKLNTCSSSSDQTKSNATIHLTDGTDGNCNRNRMSTEHTKNT